MVAFSTGWCYGPVLNGHGPVLNGPPGLFQKDSVSYVHMYWVGGMVEETMGEPLDTSSNLCVRTFILE